MSSVLGHLVQKFSALSQIQEDVASESLAYILKESEDARLKFEEIINFSCSCKDLLFDTQIARQDKGRTDISGHDQNGHEVLIVEVKFFAGLTDNQPLGYLKRLHDVATKTGAKTCLVFVCPESRRQNVFNEINKRILESGQTGYRPDSDHHSFLHEEYKITILVKSWDDVLFPIRSVLEAKLKRELVSDIDQIIGLCNQVEKAAFLPLQQSDFWPETARKICSYSNLADKVWDKLSTERIEIITDSETKTYIPTLDRQNATPQKFGYTRYFNINPFCFALNVDYKRWDVEAGTFFWISCRPKDQQTGKLIDPIPVDHIKKLKVIASQLGVNTTGGGYGGVQLPLTPEYGEFDENKVAAKLAQQIIEIFRRLMQ